MGYFRSRLGGRPRAGALPGADDRRRHQLELGSFRGIRRHLFQHGRVVGIHRKEWPDAGCLHGSRFDVHRAAAERGKRTGAAGCGSFDSVGPQLAGTGNRLCSGELSAGQRPRGTQLPDGSGSLGQATTASQSPHSGSGQRASGKRVLAGME